jgi:hypothetical protein
MGCLKAVVRQLNAKRAFFTVMLILLLLSFSVVAYAQSGCSIVQYEGSKVVLNPAAYDPDPEIGPAGELVWEFGPPFNSQGVWQTKKGQRGVFPFWVSVSDGEYKDTRKDCVELLVNNRDPMLLPLNDVFITRGDVTQISASCYDPDGDPVEISYRFMGKDVAFIRYEPPGVYDVEVICTDGFGGLDSERTKLHILMPEVIEQPRPKTVFVPPPAPKPTEIELVLPKGVKNDSVDVVYPACTPCPSRDNIEVVVYDSIETLQPQGKVNDTGSFVISSPAKPAQAKAPAPAKSPAVVIQPKKTLCADDLARKAEISKVMGKCC